MDIRSGVYRHYKNHDYSVIGCATHTESGEGLVIYRTLGSEQKLWARPKRMFLSKVTVDGREVQRFEYIGEQDPTESNPGMSSAD